MDISFSAPGNATVSASYNTATGYTGFTVEMPGGFGFDANSDNLERKVRAMLETGLYGTTELSPAILDSLLSFSADIDNIVATGVQGAAPRPEVASVTVEPSPVTGATGLSTPSAVDNYVNGSDLQSDQASDAIQAQKDPYSKEYVNSSDAASDKAAADAEAAKAAYNPGDILDNPGKGLTESANSAAQPTSQDLSYAVSKGDWRVRLSLAPSANYLYAAPNPGILKPLAATGGVIFPYTPSIQVNYAAHYDSADPVHSNYKIFQYKNSGVDSINITCEFTAQDTFEANYLLAVIHFFKSVTKMFYGKDQSPNAGTPPPLCFLTGLGAFQFDNHPLAITTFNYSLPTDVDYIRATLDSNSSGSTKKAFTVGDAVAGRLAGANLAPGGRPTAPDFAMPTKTMTPTYVPTKMQLQISAVPVVSRNAISNEFSLQKYATGELTRGSLNNYRGIW